MPITAARGPLAALALTAALLASAGAARADVPGDHPHYLHALSDLRTARAYLNHPDEWNVVADERRAVVEIDQAIRETYRGAQLDRKDVDDAVRVDARLARLDRLHRARTLLAAAQRDLGFEEDNVAARRWRAAARHDVGDAIGFVDAALRADWRDDHRS